ncbi:MBL fold metallo-hydrolase [Pseudonocardia sp. WMMC193]|uniref:MBL fold metallo-hydrolase n=1 Tax=Pseudonocardia sp. WMMC193 TaxID=2911965 RepID=UPI001F1F6962|nr:MBL fold metallo-hydrolase [Pseudonocardia sp. WMMC193]MCF7547892.1 MBL fold metallo-hydrolase [Pseudonocardia sp. WMMC193]
MSLSLGTLTVDRVVELEHWPFAPEELFPGLDPCGRLDLQIATYLVRTSDVTVLVDAGNGNDKHRPVLAAHADFRTDYLDRLTALVPPESVDVVVCTHLHPDHCGGLTRLVDGEWVPVFPRARHLLAAADLDWLAGLAAGPADGVLADLARTYADSVAPVVDAGLVSAVEAPHEVVPGITLRPLPGHTAGHLVVDLDGAAVISGDAIHHPLQFDDLDLSQAGDADPVLAARSRHQLCTRLADDGGLLLPAHFSPGRLTRSGDRLHYVPTEL